MTLRFGMIAVLMGLLTGCQSLAPPRADEADVKAVLHNLAGAYNACQIDKAVSHYMSDVYFVSSNTKAPITNVEGVRQYFEFGCKLSPPPVVVIESQSVRLAGEYAFSTGSYTFTVVQGGKTILQPNNFTLTLHRQDRRWLIVSHHTSLKP